MNEQERNSSLLKKERLINKLAVDQQSSFLATWWIEIANLIKEAGVNWNLEYLEVVNQNQYDFWIEQLKREPWANFSFPDSVIQQGNIYWVHELFYSNYPSSLPLRYLPKLEKWPINSSDNGATLKEIIAKLNMSNQPIYLFFVRMSPVIKMDLFDLALIASNDIMPDQEDTAIMAIDGSWVIFKSLEQEWVFGHI
ncbi:hypothetical protein [Sediminibacterium sp.]|uniref:hypothetical protein n=1 Tax=Sediminibacterium sp. TaxID=1917865 RepID=UPI0025E4D4D7|nr:hypothetical protein [Sediminibacterium sp.]MBT9483934.1 hypothetical protein [Sediminibacterium sp.]